VITCPTFHDVSFGEWRLPGRNDEVIEQKAAQLVHAVCCGA
jgi:hypothetical protein